MIWLMLLAAIAAEVCATTALKIASTAGRQWYLAVVTGYVRAFSLLQLTLSMGLALGVAYGIWTALGIALTAVISRVFFAEPITAMMIGGIGVIGVGVVFVELGANH